MRPFPGRAPKLSSLLAVLALSGSAWGMPQLRDGDIIFQDSQSTQSVAIKAATHSPYSHVGIVLHVDGRPFVFEAVQPVSATPLDKWIARGKGSHYVVKRLVSSFSLTGKSRQELLREANRLLKKDYDWQFGWSDRAIYCSEYVWKVYARALGLKLCPLRKLEDFDLSQPIVKQTLHERYGNKVPLSEPVVAPSDLFDSTLLTTVP